MAVGSFNFGYQHKHLSNFSRLCAKLVEEADLDLLFGSEVGAFEKGFSNAGIDVENVLEEPFGAQNVKVSALENYLAIWGFGGASQPVVVFPHGTPQLFSVPIGRVVKAAIHEFIVHARDGASQPAKAFVVIGNVHIICGKCPPSILTRQRAVRLLAQHLQTFTAPEPGMPVVRIMVGDNNLTSKQARECLQRERELDPLWEVLPALADGNGDHIVVSGATARFSAIPVGISFQDRGMRNDQHDACLLYTSPSPRD